MWIIPFYAFLVTAAIALEPGVKRPYAYASAALSMLLLSVVMYG